MKIHNIKELIKNMTIAEIYTISIVLLFTLFATILFPWISNPWKIYALNFSLIILIVSFGLYCNSAKTSKVLNLVRGLYFAPMIFLIYSQIFTYIKIINPNDLDYMLISADKFLIGSNPTDILFKISHPALTEYLQFAYMTFFFQPAIIGIDLELQHRDKEFFEYISLVAFGFYISYLLYFFVPAIGPRFTLHDFANLNTDLPGLWLTNFFRDTVNAGGGISASTLNPAMIINRDCMPSGHTMMTLINIIMAFKLKIRSRYFILLIGSSLIFSTIYLRYHYLVDVMAGIICALIVLKFEPKLKLVLQKHGIKL